MPPERYTATCERALGALSPRALRADPGLCLGEESADLPEQHRRSSARSAQGIDSVETFQNACCFMHTSKVVGEGA
jgi:hypothetical protein